MVLWVFAEQILHHLVTSYNPEQVLKQFNNYQEKNKLQENKRDRLTVFCIYSVR